jgi:hypothetical protein
VLLHTLSSRLSPEISIEDVEMTAAGIMYGRGLENTNTDRRQRSLGGPLEQEISRSIDPPHDAPGRRNPGLTRLRDRCRFRAYVPSSTRPKLTKLAAKARPLAETHNPVSMQLIETGIDVATGAAVTYMPRRQHGRPTGSRDTCPRPSRTKLVARPTLYHREDLAPE